MRTMFTPTRRCGTAYVLFCSFLILCSSLSQTFAQGLVNPAEKDFTEYKSEAKTSGNFAKKSPVFYDRTLPNEQSEAIRQVSTTENDPFPTATQTPPESAFPLESGTSTTPPTMMPNVPAEMQYAVPMYSAMNSPATNNPAADYAVQLAQQQLLQQQLAQSQQFQFSQQYLPQYPQEYAASMNVNPYAPYGNVSNPYAALNMPMNVPQQNYQNGSYQNGGTPNQSDYSSVYQLLLQQEMARRQTEEGQTETNADKEGAEDKNQTDAGWTLNNLVPVKVSSPLGESLLVCAKTISPFASPSGPDRGVGMPLVNKSWLDHPWYFGGFVGSMCGSELVSGMVDQESGGSGGFMFGYNFNEYWGIESRLHFASLDIFDTDRARQLVAELYPDVMLLPVTRTNELTIIDASVHYYPLGNAKWRPFFKYGLGFGQQKFVDTFGFDQSENIIAMPLGLGMRYWWNERIAVQMDLVDNIIFASGNAKTQNNFTFTVGLTYSFGTGTQKRPVHYWPTTPSMGSKW